MTDSKMKVVYSIAERNGKSYFNRIGVAFVNQDGSMNVKLEALPINGELHIRDYVPRDESGGTARRPTRDEQGGADEPPANFSGRHCPPERQQLPPSARQITGRSPYGR